MPKRLSFFEKLISTKQAETPKTTPTEKEKKFVVEPAVQPEIEVAEEIVAKVPENWSSASWTDNNEFQLAIDVYQTPNDIVLKSTIAGVNPEDLDVTITNDMVTIKGKRKNEESVRTENYYQQECYWGSFSRTYILPVDVEPDKAEATIKNGVLSIRLPKIEKIKTKKIKIKAV